MLTSTQIAEIRRAADGYNWPMGYLESDDINKKPSEWDFKGNTSMVKLESTINRQLLHGRPEDTYVGLVNVIHWGFGGARFIDEFAKEWKSENKRQVDETVEEAGKMHVTVELLTNLTNFRLQSIRTTLKRAADSDVPGLLDILHADVSDVSELLHINKLDRVPDDVRPDSILGKIPRFGWMSFASKLKMFVDPERYVVLDRILRDVKFGRPDTLFDGLPNGGSIVVNRKTDQIYMNWCSACRITGKQADMRAVDVERGIWMIARPPKKDPGDWWKKEAAERREKAAELVSCMDYGR